MNTFIYLFVGFIWALVSCIGLYTALEDDGDCHTIKGYAICFFINLILWPITFPVTVLFNLF